MRKETVPIDMSSEQKTILGFISRRQLIYIIAGGVILYAYVPYVFTFFSNLSGGIASLLMGLIASLISAIPVLGVVFIFGFLKKDKLHLNFDHYFLIKLGYKKQIGIWRKGRKASEWMVKR